MHCHPTLPGVYPQFTNQQTEVLTGQLQEPLRLSPADKPGIVPAGTEGATEDIVAYENAIAVVDNDGASQQLMVGTLVQFGAAWRLADLPRTISENAVLADNGLFFPASASNRTPAVTSRPENPS